MISARVQEASGGGNDEDARGLRDLEQARDMCGLRPAIDIPAVMADGTSRDTRRSNIVVNAW